MTKYLFVYGTLKRGYSMGNKLASAEKFVGPGYLPGFFIYDLGGFPAVLPHRSQATLDACTPVVGEVFEIVNERALPWLDAYEGTPHLYRREKVKVDVDIGTEGIGPYQTIEAWTYVFNDSSIADRLEPIASGEWQRNGRKA